MQEPDEGLVGGGLGGAHELGRRVRQQFDQNSPAVGVVADAPFGHRFAGLVEQGDVMVFFRPVDSACHRHRPAVGHGRLLVGPVLI
ncbi:hypothetical protein [Streptosporangium sp. NPDC003464]